MLRPAWMEVRQRMIRFYWWVLVQAGKAKGMETQSCVDLSYNLGFIPLCLQSLFEIIGYVDIPR